MELDFIFHPQVVVDGRTLDVKVGGASTVFIDHEDFVHVAISTKQGIIAEDPRVSKNEDAIVTAITGLARSAHLILSKAESRAKLMRGGA